MLVSSCQVSVKVVPGHGYTYSVPACLSVCLSVTVFTRTSRRLLACRFAVYFCLAVLVVSTIRVGTAHSSC